MIPSGRQARRSGRRDSIKLVPNRTKASKGENERRHVHHRCRVHPVAIDAAARLDAATGPAAVA